MQESRKWPVWLGIAAVGTALVGFSFDRGLSFILRTRPERGLRVARRLFGHSLNPIVLWVTSRFHIDQPVVYHTGRKSGHQYVTPLCVSPTAAGYIVPVAFGPDVDWLANLRATPRTRLTYGGVTHPVIAEVIDANEAVQLAGGNAACRCWDEYGVEQFVLLRPDEDERGSAGEPNPRARRESLIPI